MIGKGGPAHHPILGGVLSPVDRTIEVFCGLLMVLVNREFSGIQNVTDSGPAVLSIEGLKSVESEIQIDETPLGGPSGMLVQDQPRC